MRTVAVGQSRTRSDFVDSSIGSWPISVISRALRWLQRRRLPHLRVCRTSSFRDSDRPLTHRAASAVVLASSFPSSAFKRSRICCSFLGSTEIVRFSPSASYTTVTLSLASPPLIRPRISLTTNGTIDTTSAAPAVMGATAARSSNIRSPRAHGGLRAPPERTSQPWTVALYTLTVREMASTNQSRATTEVRGGPTDLPRLQRDDADRARGPGRDAAVPPRPLRQPVEQPRLRRGGPRGRRPGTLPGRRPDQL